MTADVSFFIQRIEFAGEQPAGSSPEKAQPRAQDPVGFTTQADTKKFNRKGELALRDAELQYARTLSRSPEFADEEDDDSLTFSDAVEHFLRWAEKHPAASVTAAAAAGFLLGRLVGRIR